MAAVVEESEEFHDCSDRLPANSDKIRDDVIDDNVVRDDSDDVIDTLTVGEPDFIEASSSTATTTSKNGEVEECTPPSCNEYFVDEVYLAEICQLMSEEKSFEQKEKAIQLKAEGNRFFAENSYEDAARIYSKALCTCPILFNDLRAILYSNRAACFAKMEQPDEAIADCSKSIDLDCTFTKSFTRRAQLYEQKDENFEKALEDYKTVLKAEPNNKLARDAVARLPTLIAERNERMKNDMIEKLKDLGNLVLRPFGLSTENFKLEPNPNGGGGYSVKIQK